MESALARYRNLAVNRLTATVPGRPIQLALLFVIVWLIAHPYLRLRHDGILYFGQLLHRISPDSLAADPFFRFGSQDSYSLFSTLVMWATNILGVFTAAPLLLAFTQIGAAATVVLLAFRLLDRSYAWYGAIFVAAMPAWYGGWHTFSYAENFLTARSFAEPLILLALALLLSAQRWWSLALLALAALTHPLMALPALAIWWLNNTLHDRRFYWFALLGLVPIALGLIGITPFDKLFASYDADWAKVVVDVNAFVIPSQWRLTEWCAIAVDFAVLIAMYRRSENLQVRRFIAALTFSSAALVVISEAGFTLLHNVLLTGLQTWRSLWLVHLIAMICLPVLILESLKRNDSCGRLLAPLWLITTLAASTYAGPITAVVALSLVHWDNKTCPQLSTTTIHIALWLGVLAILLTIGLRAVPTETITTHILAETDYNYWRFIRTSAAQSPIPLFVFLMLLSLTLTTNSRKLSFLILTLITSLLIATADQRTPWDKYIGRHHNNEHPFLQYVGPTEEIYWDSELLVPWLLLNRPSYYHKQQASGSLFNRDTAMFVARRKSLLKYIEFQLSICSIYETLEWKSNTKNRSTCIPGAEVLQDLCRSDDPPAYLVLNAPLALAPLSTWETPIKQGHDYKTYHLYSCGQLRDINMANQPSVPRPS